MNIKQRSVCKACRRPVHQVGTTCDHADVWYHDRLTDSMNCPGTAPHVEPESVPEWEAELLDASRPSVFAPGSLRW
jgi:hypothetical protein